MAQQLKRWESPRRKGRNHKGRGGSAKQRQYIKRQKLLRKRLQAGIDGSAADKASGSNNAKKGEAHEPLLFYCPVILPSDTAWFNFSVQLPLNYPVTL